MQQRIRVEQSARVSASAAVIKCAIQDRVCLSGTHVSYRVRFAPHALGRDENGRLVVFGFEYGGMTLGRAHWVCFAVHRLRGLQRNEDAWRSGSVESRPLLGLADIEAGVDESFSLSVDRHLPMKGATSSFIQREDRGGQLRPGAT